MKRTLFVACLLLCLGIAPESAAQDSRAGQPAPLIIESISGEDSFNFYCATCHGRDGRGAGPVATALNTTPANLTALTRRNRGIFPRAEVISFVTGTGRALPSHGPGDMPVWGPIFRALERSDPRVRIRIENIADYIESLQIP